MKKYKVIELFRDKHTDKLYKEGDTYSHADEARIKELMNAGYLEKDTVEKAELKHTGGGWYELPNGEKIQGKEEALAALEEIETRGE
ncbi:hypothetical protein [Pseudobacillus badius]|uniref:hypothetical protein n=1 Tax=Bacillus badius TaxID=1455 RepID=UPI0024A08AF6|nr:hypothetical protein [Bacillus badius]GLY09594.1 hypothetical protein Bbad01_08100 [Bacillus badius]